MGRGVCEKYWKTRGESAVRVPDIHVQGVTSQDSIGNGEERSNAQAQSARCLAVVAYFICDCEVFFRRPVAEKK